MSPGTPFPDGIDYNLKLGLAGAFILTGVLGGWAATAELSGAVVAGGTLVVESNVKKVQHPTGGVVGEIRVREGDKVEAGDIVMRLDETVTKANLQVITRQLDELAVRTARLKAERDGKARFELPAMFSTRASDAEIHEILADERLLFDSRLLGHSLEKGATAGAHRAA